MTSSADYAMLVVLQKLEKVLDKIINDDSIKLELTIKDDYIKDRSSYGRKFTFDHNGQYN